MALKLVTKVTVLLLVLLSVLFVNDLEVNAQNKKAKKETVKKNKYDEKLDNLKKALDNWVYYAKKNMNGENVYRELDDCTRSFAEKYEDLSQDSEDGKLSKAQYNRLVQIYEEYNSYLEQGY